MSHRRSAPPTPVAAPTLANYSGVNFTDAAPGEIALVVFIRGKRVLKLEISEQYYSSRWVHWLQRWALRQEPAVLKLVD